MICINTELAIVYLQIHSVKNIFFKLLLTVLYSMEIFYILLNAEYRIKIKNQISGTVHTEFPYLTIKSILWY